MNKPIASMVGMIGAFALIVMLLIYQWLNPRVEYPIAQAGMLDARGWSFTEQGVIPLKGEWEFYAGQILTPKIFKTVTNRCRSLRC